MSKKLFRFEHTIDELEDKLSRCEAELIAANEGELDMSQDLQEGPFLHQDGPDRTEEESAQFELKNPAVFAFIRSLKQRIHNILES